MTRWKQFLEGWGGLITAAAALIAALILLLDRIPALGQRMRRLWSAVLKPAVVLMFFLATAAVPALAITWVLMYTAAQNANRLQEPGIFFALVAQATAAGSLYTFFWGMWLYPRLRSWFEHQVSSARAAWVRWGRAASEAAQGAQPLQTEGDQEAKNIQPSDQKGDTS